MTEVPTVLLSGLSEEREREIVIRDNVENGEWDMDILANEWDTTDLKEWGAEINWNEQNIADNDEIELDELSDEMELKIKLSSEDYRKVVDALRDIDENLSEAIKKVLNV